MNIFKAVEEKAGMLPEKYRQMTTCELEAIVQRVKTKLGSKLFLPGHHYQKDEVIQFADATGDSLKLAQLSEENKEAEYIVFCGVHFMAETADILTTPEQKVYLPDMRAGCSMADMADIHQTDRAWLKLAELFGNTILPLTYVNSTAAIKAFVGKNGGATVTSSNAEEMVTWAFEQKQRILFLPDQHLGRNTAFNLGVPLNEMAVWNPILDRLEFEGDIEKVKVILWKGHCSVHENFTVENIKEIRQSKPDMKIIVHPECSREVVELSDLAGSTNYIINEINRSEQGSAWAIGTEMNLVNRIIKEHPDKEIVSLNPHMCPCMTMNRIDLPHLAWCLEAIEQGEPHNIIKVESHIGADAKLALDRMLAR
ncbi:quinolinate synthase [Cytobacillus horneckiae]|uniref:Quinolinate synthase n=1 Tax=Cytobacillus horneckiae TaxID=549687 RepID=A0A2N0ZJW1_9BACI|nr:quinolinate synthase NadA [Cytobacillus horneckiae]MBN6887855.1 quinolinate synthase NadA [Cytobacillus horneckiae]MCM3179790.1 quinolinate synthase NadA [Cytobacillus horneckiae]MEC1155177.1 quinolinate synthase NadA [Cytobacillus horneckiae]MED2936770.1 quinolinate synthase NadA [Cytobacillus horneckiae]PKG29805.1 quinolinate synthase NadA [Cytobacillus horneckiae]